MFCTHCGEKMDDDAVFCSKCGAAMANHESKPPEANHAPFGQAYEQPGNMYRPAQNDMYPYAQNGPYSGGVPATNTLATVGFILSFFVAIAGLILSINGLRRSRYMNGAGKKLAIAGIIISGVNMFLGFILYIALMLYTPSYLEYLI